MSFLHARAGCRVACFVVAVIAAFPAAAASVPKSKVAFLDECVTTLPVPLEPSSKVAKGVNAFFKEGLGIDEVEDLKVVTTSQPTYERPDACEEVSLTVGPEHDRASVKVDPKSGKVLFFSLEGLSKREEKEIGNRTHKDAISKDAAWESMQPLLKYYGLDTDRQRHTIEMEDHWTMYVTDDLLGANWTISEDLTYEGLTCPHRIIYIQASAYSGKILHAQCWPVIPPKNRKPRISKEEAAEHARAWLEQYSQELHTDDVHIDEDALNAMVQIVALPNPAWLRNAEKAPAEKPGEAYVCWVVPVYFMTNSCGKVSSPLVIRADNGNVIDAYGVFPRLIPDCGEHGVIIPLDNGANAKPVPAQ